jgi:hypothetical protein
MLQIITLRGNIIKYIYIYILYKNFTGAYEPVTWFSMVQYYIFIENHCWILLSTYSIVMRIFSSSYMGFSGLFVPLGRVWL